MASIGPEDQDATSPDVAAGILTQVTRAISAIYKERLGRGPSNAHSHFAGANSIVCYLETTLTPVEQTLVSAGKVDEMQNLRQLFQAATRASFCAAVEEVTGRTVVSFMSANDVENDVASEIFIFAPSTS